MDKQIIVVHNRGRLAKEPSSNFSIVAVLRKFEVPIFYLISGEIPYLPSNTR